MNGINSLPAPSLVSWPRDEAAHKGFPWEIWWITTDVRSADHRLATHLMLTHLESGHVGVTVAITDLDEETELSTRYTAEPNRATLATDHLETTTSAASLRGTFSDGYRVHGQVDDHTGFDLVLSPTRPVLYNGGAGQFTLGELTTTQYSMGGLETTGTVRFAGEDMHVNGHAWYDRQWIDSGRLADAGGVFTWFGICLDNGDTISLWDTSMRECGGHTWATIVRADGTHVVTAARPASDGASDIYKTALGRNVPRRWRLIIPGMHAELEVVQRLVQDAPGRFFYTGALDVNGFHEGRPVIGFGFCDLVAWSE